MGRWGDREMGEDNLTTSSILPTSLSPHPPTSSWSGSGLFFAISTRNSFLKIHQKLSYEWRKFRDC